MAQRVASKPDFGSDRTWTISFDCAQCGIQGILDDRGTINLADGIFRGLGMVRGGIPIGVSVRDRNVGHGGLLGMGLAGLGLMRRRRQL